jgi:hypothetical protein
LKKYIAFLIICATVFLCACSSYENATFIDCGDGQCLVYQGEKYFAAPGFVTAEGFEHANADNIQLGYFYSFPFSTYFYSDTLEDPDYISTAGSDTGVYFKKDYAYQTDTFVIVGTEHEFVFSDALTLSPHLHTKDGKVIRVNLRSYYLPKNTRAFKCLYVFFA